MPTRKNTPFNVTLLGVLLLLVLFTTSPQTEGAFLFGQHLNRFTYHFYHANIFHFLANAWALWLMRPSFSDLAKAYPLAVIASLFALQPTIGFSAIIYAYIGINIIRWKVSLVDWGVFITANLITLFIPNIAFGVHFAAFTLGITTWKLKNSLKKT